jgi:hypothetical protein
MVETSENYHMLQCLHYSAISPLLHQLQLFLHAVSGDESLDVSQQICSSAPVVRIRLNPCKL